MKYIFIHGLNGSSKSAIAGQLKSAIGDDLIVPDLPNNPTEWYKEIVSIVNSLDDCIIIGNSTGGLIGNYIGQEKFLSTVLINPVVDSSSLEPYIGVNENLYTNEKWILTKEDVIELSKYEVNRTVSPTFILLSDNDTILDSRKTIYKFNRFCDIKILKDQPHRCVLTDEDIDEIVNMKNIIPL